MRNKKNSSHLCRAREVSCLDFLCQCDYSRREKKHTIPASANCLLGYNRNGGTVMEKKIEIYDSTLRDGALGEGLQFSLEDRLEILKALDRLGILFIEGGNPAASKQDMEFFHQAKKLPLESARLVAYGGTRKSGVSANEDAGCQALLASGTDVVTIAGWSWDQAVRERLCVNLEENIRMIYDTIQFFKRHGKMVIFNAVHFFDGYKSNFGYAMEVMRNANEAGADRLVLCDSNGACFPHEVFSITQTVVREYGGKVGAHFHNDVGCAVANCTTAVRAGATQIQGNYLGLGERCGDVQLSVVIPNLQLKSGYSCIPNSKMELVTRVASFIAETANINIPANMPYLGRNAFAHKDIDSCGGKSAPSAHISPELVGNRRNVLLSEFIGKSGLLAAVQRLDPAIAREEIQGKHLGNHIRAMERKGYQFESAVASLILMVVRELRPGKQPFELASAQIAGDPCRSDQPILAVVKVKRKGESILGAGEGKGTIDALASAFYQALGSWYPALQKIRIIDYKVRLLDTAPSGERSVRVAVTVCDGELTWCTLGISKDVLQASCQALQDALLYGCMQTEEQQETTVGSTPVKQ